jgi:hyperosmotically inducible protein
MVKGGAVTLRGPVDSADETAKIEAIAKGVRGVKKIDNQLDVKTK